LALIDPLGKLGWFLTAALFQVTISLPSWAIRANTSCTALVLLGLALKLISLYVWSQNMYVTWT